MRLRLLPRHRFARRFATSGSMLGATLSMTFAGHTNGPAQAMTGALLTGLGVCCSRIRTQAFSESNLQGATKLSIPYRHRL